MEFPSGTKVGLYDASRNLVETIDVEPDGTLTRPAEQPPGGHVVLAVPSLGLRVVDVPGGRVDRLTRAT